MATQTTHYNLTKPAGTDSVDITVLNGNADIIDAKLYSAISSITDSVEGSTTAAEEHPLGSCFWMNNIFYKATAAISIGDTITPGTNCDATTVMQELGGSSLPSAAGVSF